MKHNGDNTDERWSVGKIAFYAIVSIVALGCVGVIAYYSILRYITWGQL